MKEIIISKNEKDKRLDSFLKAYLPNASSGFIYKMLRKKNITLNGKKAEGTEKLAANDVIKIFFSDETFEKFRGKKANLTHQREEYKVLQKIGDLKIIYEDENIILVDKPAGLLSQKSKPSDMSLNDWLIEYLLKKGDISEETLETYHPSICNRLDRNTSGIVICAKTLSGARVMNQMLKDRTLDKYYRTIVSGKIDKPILIKGYLFKNEEKNKVIIKSEDPKDDRYSYIETEIAPVKYDAERNLTVLEVKLITGKTHQIRAHLANQGHPVIGDVKYGGKVIAGQNYQLLHSYRLSFPSQMSSELDYLAGKEFVSELPYSFTKILKS